MSQIKFELRLPNGPGSNVVIVAGGADSNRDGRIDQNSEIAAFTRNGNDGHTWSRTQTIGDQISGTEFYVSFMIGVGVRWELTVTDDAGKVLRQASNTSVLAWSDVLGVLP
jgi:hypothetical protein